MLKLILDFIIILTVKMLSVLDKFFNNKNIALYYFHSLQEKIHKRIMVEDLHFDATHRLPMYRGLQLLKKEPDTIRWIDDFFKQGEIFYDIGSNIGVFALYAAKKGVNVYAFEPEAGNYYILNKNIYYNGFTEKIKAFNLALNDSNKFSVLNLSNINIGKSGHSFDTNMDSNHSYYEPIHKQGVFGLSLDDAINIYNLPFPHHIKIDVDGNEHRILRGMKKTLSDKRLRSIAVELNMELNIDKEIIETILSEGFTQLGAEEYKNKKYMELGSIYNFFFSRT